MSLRPTVHRYMCVLAVIPAFSLHAAAGSAHAVSVLQESPPQPPPASPCECDVGYASPGSYAGCGTGYGYSAGGAVHSLYLFSGEFHLSATDLHINGRLLDFAWARKYRSRIGPNTAMGNGWDFSYNVFIEQSGPDLLLHDGNTRDDLYLFQAATNTWEADEFFREFTLDPNPVPFGTYTLTFADTSVWRFVPFDGSSQQGKISESSDRNGNTLVFDYNGLGQLATIHDTLDTAGHTRDITIAYNADGFIESVTDFTGRQVVYDYYQAPDTGTLDGWSLHFDAGGPPIMHTIPVGSPIDSDLPPTTSVFMVPDAGPILDLNVDLQLTHSELADLRIELSHLATTVVLWDGQCSGESNMDVLFDDLGTPAACASPVLGTIAPLDLLSDFNGMDLNGEWTLTVTDLVGSDPNGSAGDLKSATTPAVVGTPHGNDFPSGKTTIYTYSKDSPEPDLDGNLLTITDPKGQLYLTNEYAPTLNPGDLDFDHVARQIWGDPTDTVDIVYTQLTPDPGNNFAVVKATVNDRVGNVSDHFYNGSDQLVIVRDYIGRADPTMPSDLDGAANAPVGPLRTDDSLCDPVATFPAFETRFEWNVDSLATLIEYPNGNSTQCVYEIDLNPMAAQRVSGNLREIRFIAGPLGGDQGTISHFFQYEPGFGSPSIPPNPIHAPDPIKWHAIEKGCDTLTADVHNSFYQRSWFERGSGPGSPGEGAPIPFEVPTRASGWSAGSLRIAPSSESDPDPIKLRHEPFDPGCDDKILDVKIDWSDPICPDFGSQLVPGVAWEGGGFMCSSPRRRVGADTAAPFTHRFCLDYFDSAGFVTLHTDGRGNQTQHSYDPNGNRLQTIHRIPSIVDDFAYNSFGQMTFHKLPDNGSASRREDSFDYYLPADGCMNGYLKEKIIDAPGFGLTTTYEYDCLGRMTRAIDPRGNDSLFEYNALDQMVRTQTRQVTGGGTRYEGLTYYDPNDNVIRIDIENKDESGVLQPNTDFTTTYEYDILNYMTRKCEEIGNIALGPADLDCSAMAPAESITTEIEYDANRNPTLLRLGEATNGNQPNNTIKIEYDERDLVFKVTRGQGDAAQSTNQTDYDCNGNLKRISRGLEGPSALPPADILITDYVYDGFNRLTRTTDPMGNVTERHYDANGNVGGDQAPAMPNPFGLRRLGEIIDIPGDAGNARLFETTYEYDFMDRMTRQVTDFFDTQTQAPLTDGASVLDVEYSDNSQITRAADDNAHQILAIYDTVNRAGTITDHKNNRITFTYDPNSNILTVKETEKSDLLNPDEEFTTTYAYDNLDRLTRITDNVGNANSAGYDSRNNRTLSDDALGNLVRYAYDGINRLTSTTRDLDGDGADGDGSDIVTVRLWDDTSRLIDLGDDAGNVTTYEYDVLNRITRTTYADCTDSALTYDVHDNRLTLIDPNGSASTCTYDLLNRLETKSIVPGAGVSTDTTFETYAYDGLNRLVRAEDDDSIVTRAYDSLSNVTEEVLTVDPLGVPTVGTVTSTYDGVGNRLTCVYPGGRVITCVYDELDRKATISDGGGTIATYDYIGPGRVERREYGNGTRTDDAYDGITGIPNPAGDLGVKLLISTTHSRIAGGSLIDSRSYAWDRMYNKLKREDLLAGGPELTHTYVYDSIYRLTRTTVTDASSAGHRLTDYTLDGVGNRQTVGGGPDSGPYALDPSLCEPGDFQMNQYSSTPSGERTHDPNGNLTTFGCLFGDFNADDVLDELDVPPFVDDLLGQALPSCGNDPNHDGVLNGLDVQPLVDGILGSVVPARRIQMSYDYRNRMVSHADLLTGVTTTYAYDALSRRIERIVDADGAADETRYFYDGYQVIEEQDDAAATHATYVYGLYIDEVLNMQRGGGDFYYHTDDIFSVMAVTAAAGNVVERYEYDDYGEPQRRVASQAGDLSAAALSDIDFFPNTGNVQFIADNFSVAVETRITGLRWWGGSFPDPTTTDDFTIEIRLDDGPGGAPGTLLVQDPAGNVTRLATGGIIATGSLVEYVYDYRLTRPFIAQPGQNYWLVIKNDTTGQATTWAWELSVAGDGALAFEENGGGWQLDTGDLAFELITDISTVGNPYLFTGRRYDPESGWYYYRTRYMDPHAGRFTTRDTIGIWGDAANLGNGYTYVGNRPTCMLDPSGMQVPPTGPMMPGQSMGWWLPNGSLITVSYWGPGIRMGGYQWFVYTPAQFATFLSPPGFPFGFIPIPMWPGAGIQGGGAGKLGLACLDESCRILTRDGPRPIGDIKIGDEVLTPDGEFRKVIDKDFGRVRANRLDDYVKITVGENSVVLTRDHIIGDKPAGKWRDGDEMILHTAPRRGSERFSPCPREGRIVSVTVEPATSTISGDLRLEGDADYVIRGGFVVGSMMSRYGISTPAAISE